MDGGMCRRPVYRVEVLLKPERLQSESQRRDKDRVYTAFASSSPPSPPASHLRLLLLSPVLDEVL